MLPKGVLRWYVGSLPLIILQYLQTISANGGVHANCDCRKYCDIPLKGNGGDNTGWYKTLLIVTSTCGFLLMQVLLGKTPIDSTISNQSLPQEYFQDRRSIGSDIRSST